MPEKTVWRNRIVGSGIEQAGQLLANPANWRIHSKVQQEAMAGALSEIGWIQQVIVNKTTGNLIDGHLRVVLALRQGEETPVPVEYIELSEAEEALALATLDPIGAMAAADKGKLESLLKEINTGEAALQQALEDLAVRNGIIEPQIDYEKEWEGMPEFENCPKAFKTIHIHFEKEEDIKLFEEKYNFIIGDKTVSFWFPEKQRRNLRGMGWNNES